MKKMYLPRPFSGGLLIDFVEFSGLCHSRRYLHKTKSRLRLIDFLKELYVKSVFSPVFESAAWFLPPAKRRMISLSPSLFSLEKPSSFPLEFEPLIGPSRFPPMLVDGFRLSWILKLVTSPT